MRTFSLILLIFTHLKIRVEGNAPVRGSLSSLTVLLVLFLLLKSGLLEVLGRRTLRLWAERILAEGGKVEFAARPQEVSLL